MSPAFPSATITSTPLLEVPQAKGRFAPALAQLSTDKRSGGTLLTSASIPTISASRPRVLQKDPSSLTSPGCSQHPPTAPRGKAPAASAARFRSRLRYPSFLPGCFNRRLTTCRVHLVTTDRAAKQRAAAPGCFQMKKSGNICYLPAVGMPVGLLLLAASPLNLQ